ncbi:MAG TPA: NADPH:quinone oxidoreductase family protein [Gaiellaceae bacterium]|nr:NADPH:quinone oxidoreductase family protein [Gaiellaceae bacterium]
MKAALLREVDGPFELVGLPDPDASGKVVVHVRAAGVNFADVLIRRGRYPQMPELPVVLGSEIAGVLEDGTRVMAFTSGAGGYAELAAVDGAQVVPLPDNASFAEGASFLLTFLTAYIPLTRLVRIRPGASVLVLAAAGGVGTATIQVARSLGARVVAAAGSPEKVDLCRSLGAAETYVYAEIPGDLRVDVVVDPVGGELFERALGQLKPMGTLIAIGFAAGAWPEISPANLVGRNVGVHGFYLGRLMRHAPELVGEAVGELLGLWQAGSLKPVVGTELPLDEVERAHELVESRRSTGKVVLLP